MMIPKYCTGDVLLMKNQLLSVSGMKLIEKTAIGEGVSEEILMQNAGMAVADVIIKTFPQMKTLILCGPGKNGEDGKIAGKCLKEKGWSVEILTLKEGVSEEKLSKAMDQAELIVDALLGTGLSGPLEGPVLHWVEKVNASQKPVISVDIPTGINADTGNFFTDAIKATLTVTFVHPRLGHYLLPGRVYSGRLVVKDIGASSDFVFLPPYYLNTPSLWLEFLKEPCPFDHKYTRGACLVFGNGSMPGALRLSSLAARRVGAGLVRITCKEKDYPILASCVLGDIITPLKTAKQFLEWAEDNRFRALLWGVGAFPEPSTRDQAVILLATQKPCVLDGGALSSFEGKTQELITHLHSNVILTPHEGEFLRLFPHLAFLSNKVEKALKAALETGAVIVLKGYDTIIASPEGEVLINANAPSTLATAGTGDVLAGLMVGLLAQKIPAFQAAAMAVWIHGEAATRKGVGLIAEDLLNEIPEVLKFLRSLHHANDSIDGF